ncbi:MAG: hypothetical protein HY673_00445 [Chloroflexi bacterium]|nr:hypothetical protein [Chloroflexota bacterium]
MKKVKVTTIAVSVLMALGLLTGLLPSPLQTASAAPAGTAFTFWNDTGRTAADLHIAFDVAWRQLHNIGPFRRFEGQNSQDLHLFGGKVPPWGTATIRVELKGTQAKAPRGSWTTVQDAGGRSPPVLASIKATHEQMLAKLAELQQRLAPAHPAPAPRHDFILPIEDVFALRGRGTVATGRIERGLIVKPDFAPGYPKGLGAGGAGDR